MSISPNKMTSYNLQFSEEQQEWHHDQGQQPDSNGYVTVGHNFNHYHSIVLNDLLEKADGIHLSTDAARLLAKHVENLTGMMITMEFILHHGLWPQYRTFLENRGMIADMPPADRSDIRP